MVIIITGASHTGKTVLAQKLLEKYKYPYTSIDHLKMGLIRSGNTKLTPEDDDELTEYLWPIVREMVKTAIENGQDLIVEGCYVPFGWRKDIDRRYLEQIRFACLVMTEEYIDAHFDDIKDHAGDAEHRPCDEKLTPGSVKEDNRKYLEGFRAAGEEVVLIRKDYVKTIKSLVRRMGQRGAAAGGKGDRQCS
jgi:2-phosphoglycerate kinase